MKMCPNCHSQVNDDSVYCPVCGTGIDAAPQYIPQSAPQPNPQYNSTYQQPPVYAPPVPYVDPFDHTSEFDPKDISENKVIAMLVYLLGPIGVIIALLASGTSKYAGFHVRQSLKLTVIEILASIGLAAFTLLMVLLRGEVLAAFLAVILYATLLAIRVISFLQICKGQAKEPFIVRSFRFLK